MDIDKYLKHKLNIPNNWDKFDYETQRYSFNDLSDVLQELINENAIAPTPTFDSIINATHLAKNIIKILDKKGRAGCNNQGWAGFENGNGTEIGVDIERLIKQAKRFLTSNKTL